MCSIVYLIYTCVIDSATPGTMAVYFIQYFNHQDRSHRQPEFTYLQYDNSRRFLALLMSTAVRILYVADFEAGGVLW